MGVHGISKRTPEAKWGRGYRLLLAALAAVAPAFALGLPGPAGAATMTFGSQLSVPATENTANDLAYEGSNVALPGSVFHVAHDGADTALWNEQLATGSPIAPASGQIVSVSLEGCAQSNGPAPLTQIHFQTLSPQPGGGAKVDLTSQSFEIPVCGQGGASGATVSTYQPTNLCATQGDYVDFNDEGGFVGGQNGPPPYPAGVPYMVIGAVPGSTMDSFIANNGVGNGAVFSPGVTSSGDGFAANHEEELMLQATLATGADATPICPGGTKGVHRERKVVFPTLTIPTPQLDGMNARGIVQVSIYCHSSTTCEGTITLDSKSPGHSRPAWLGASQFTIPAHSTGKALIHLSARARRMVRDSNNNGLGVEATLENTPAQGTGVFRATIAVRGAWHA
jgi:hypothetical protein